MFFHSENNYVISEWVLTLIMITKAAIKIGEVLADKEWIIPAEVVPRIVVPTCEFNFGSHQQAPFRCFGFRIASRKDDCITDSNIGDG